MLGPVAKPDEVERLESLSPRFLRGHPRHEERELDVLDRAQDRHQVVELEDEAHPPGPIVGAVAVRHVGERDALDEDISVADRVQTGQAVEQRRLPGAARPHDRDHLSPVDGEVHTAEGAHLDLPRVVGLVDASCFDDRRGRGRIDGIPQDRPFLEQHSHSGPPFRLFGRSLYTGDGVAIGGDRDSGFGKLPISMTEVVKAEALTKLYGASRGVLDLDFAVEAGEVFGFLGPNGAGKTTTIRLMLDLIRPSRGRLSVFGLDSTRNSVEIRRRLGYLPGDLRVYERLTARELLRFFAHLRGLASSARGELLAERLGLDLDRRIKELSRGNRQKVGLVQAFMHEP